MPWNGADYLLWVSFGCNTIWRTMTCRSYWNALIWKLPEAPFHVCGIWFSKVLTNRRWCHIWIDSIRIGSHFDAKILWLSSSVWLELFCVLIHICFCLDTHFVVFWWPIFSDCLLIQGNNKRFDRNCITFPWKILSEFHRVFYLKYSIFWYDLRCVLRLTVLRISSDFWIECMKFVDQKWVVFLNEIPDEMINGKMIRCQVQSASKNITLIHAFQSKNTWK